MKGVTSKSLTKRVLNTLLIIAATSNISVAGEHTWIYPGQCTPPELWTRGIIGTLNPSLTEHDKILFKMEDGRLMIELEAVESKSIKIDWIWITPAKVSSGSSVFAKSSGSFELTGADDKALKELKFLYSFDSQKNRLLFRLKPESPRYALINREGEQGGAVQPATAPESKSKGKEKPKPESKVRPQ